MNVFAVDCCLQLRSVLIDHVLVFIALTTTVQYYIYMTLGP